MVLGDLKAIGEDTPEESSYMGLFLFGLLAGWMIVLSARGAHKHRKEAWYYDKAGEPHWPGDEDD